MNNILRKVRKSKGVSQKQLAEAVGTRRMTISDIENKKQVPGLKLAGEIAHYLGLSTDDIFFPNYVSFSHFEKRNIDRNRGNKKRKELLKEISALTYEKSWKEHPETVELVKEKRKELEQLRPVKKVSNNQKKVKITFTDGGSKEYDTLAELVALEHISIHTIRRHLKDGTQDQFGRMYKRVGK